MRSALIAFRATGVAVALTALTAVAAPTVVAEDWDRDRDRDRGSVSVRPNPAEPGDRVKLEVRGCACDWASATSSVFAWEARLSPGRDDRKVLWGDATIAHHAEPGWHEIRVKCEGREVRGSIQIHRDRPNPHHSPVWPVHAGGGGMAAELAASTKIAKERERARAAEGAQATVTAKKSHDADGPGLPHTVIGAVLAAAATLAVAGRALTLRRRRSGE
ncbi:hypothetical protein ACFWBH_31290 [Streptomyces sp. NPDC059999]|uniref:hypothetical protein n=1 Tax=unclassified Streptomyces TaxID=2593676 RepID=UPI002E37E4C2|nr:hypothetical protein [Streptomyces sp. NBC_01426]